MKISAKTQVCTIIGDPVEHSLSPAMHNTAYESLGISNAYVFTASHVLPHNLQKAIQGARALSIHGITVTIPHKTDVMEFLDEIDPIAVKIGAVNTILNSNGRLKGYNTDWIGVKTSFEKAGVSCKGKNAAVIGAGGASRAIVYALQSLGAKVTVFNRSIKSADEIASDFSCNSDTIENIDRIKTYDIIANSTPLGMGEHTHETPVPKEYLATNQVVFDAVYIPFETRLLREAKEVGAQCIHGIDMLLYQGTAQFTIYTGKEAPEEVMREILQ